VERALMEKVAGSMPSQGSKLDLGEGEMESLLQLPDHLRKTLLAVRRLGETTAEETSVETGRARTMESLYLNQLVRMGYLQKTRKGRRVYFKIFRYY